MHLLPPRLSLLSRFRGYPQRLTNHPRERFRFLSYTRPASASLDFQALDQKWQKRWTELGRRAASDGASKSYILAMFPYPSGALHMGHLRVYTIADVLARFKRMQGCKMLYPMGWDAFGLPAENAAIERGLDPAVWTEANVTKMKGQLKAMNGDIDWSREFMTCDPNFYKHTQRLFLLLYERGLAYQAESLVNYDPVDRTVLANEQVDANGFSWRSGAKVEKVNLKQWFLRITAFRETLLNDLDSLQQWPERVIAMQRNWLGRSNGANVRFEIVDSTGNNKSHVGWVNAFTTRPDTLFGVQFLCLSVGHPLVGRSAKQDHNLAAFLESVDSLPPDSKVGFKLGGVYARNPLRFLGGLPSSVEEPLPIYVSPYVVEGYGEGAVMGVPAHDARDWEFWKQNSGNIPARRVIDQEGDTSSEGFAEIEQPFTDTGILSNSYGRYSGLKSKNVAQTLVSDLAKAGNLAQPSETWKLRDWLISRQRYWGTPIPIIHCANCGTVPVPIDQLPVELPKITGSSFQHRSGNPLDSAHDWVNTSCPKCSGPAKRDTDTMDTFMDSSWYMFRFTDPDNTDEPFSPEMANSNMPVDIYLGGIEHAILHLLYARFIGKFLATTSLWPAGAADDIKGEPFKQQISQGMVHGKTFSDPDTGRFLKPEEVDLSNAAQPKILASGEEPSITFEKMSKSKHNGIDPSAFIAKYGADVTRAHMLFQAPISEVLEWEEERIAGIQRWLHRLWRLTTAASDALGKRETSKPTSRQPFPFPTPELTALSSDELSLHLATQRTICSITTSLSTTHALNTCISDLMSLTNTLARHQSSFSTLSPSILYRTTSSLARLIAPFAPAFADECWEILHTTIPYPLLDAASPTSNSAGSAARELGPLDLQKSIHNHLFPTASDLDQLEALAKQQKQTCAVMENGKLRVTVQIEPAAEGLSGVELEEWVLRQIEETEDGRRWMGRARDAKKKGVRWWKRVVVVGRGKAVNFVG